MDANAISRSQKTYILYSRLTSSFFRMAYPSEVIRKATQNLVDNLTPNEVQNMTFEETVTYLNIVKNKS